MKLKNLADGREFTPKQLEEILTLLESLDKHATYIKRLGGDFAEYGEKRAKDGTLPQLMVKVRDGNDETVNYFITTIHYSRNVSTISIISGAFFAKL